MVTDGGDLDRFALPSFDVIDVWEPRPPAPPPCPDASRATAAVIDAAILLAVPLCPARCRRLGAAGGGSTLARMCSSQRWSPAAERRQTAFAWRLQGRTTASRSPTAPCGGSCQQRREAAPGLSYPSHLAALQAPRLLEGSAPVIYCVYRGTFLTLLAHAG